MRSASMKQAIKLFGEKPEEFIQPENAEAYRVAQADMAQAYEKGADDEQAFDIWESSYVGELYGDEKPDAASAVLDFAMFDDLEEEAAGRQQEKG